MIAAELTISVVFMRELVGGVLVRVSRVRPMNFEDLDVALFALISPACVAPFEVSQAAFHNFARTGLLEHDRGVVLLLAGEFVPPQKPEHLRPWAARMASAWEEMVAAHVSTLNSTGTVAPSQMEYLAKRFEIDETNLWLLAEEAGEVVRSCGKIGRWGYDHVHQVTGESGMRLLEAEVGDFLATVDIMVARGHFTAEALEAAKQAKLKRLEDWYEAPWPPADVAPVAPSPTTHSAKELIESGYLAKIVSGAIEPATGRPHEVSPYRLSRDRRKEALGKMARELLPFDAVDCGGLGGGGIGGGITRSYSHVSQPECPPDPVRELPRTPEGDLDWKALDGDLVTVKQGVDGLLVEVTKLGRMQVFSGVLAKPVNISIHTNP